MSDLGALMDRIVAAAESAVSGLDAERGNRLNDHLTAGELPHLFVYGAAQSVSRASHGQKVTTSTIRARLVTRGETQEAFLVKRDSVLAGIEADATLLTLSTDVLVVSTETEEDPASDDKVALMVVQIEQEA